MKTAKWIGILFFLGGTILATISASKIPAEGSTYPDTLGIFIPGFILAVIGILIWHTMVRKLIKLELKQQDASSNDNPVTLIEKLQPNLTDLTSKIGNLDSDELCQEVDKLLDNYVLPFAEVRQTLVNMMGMSKGAQVLVTIAYGERMLNRVWSASADGHLEEAQNVYPDAVSAFQEAYGMVQHQT
ncbi:MAG: hypothetical protein KAQ98_13005 [Bacteriovoracaceae bacterium]|nr:hypothetical protein [Bacteriovoracaceae bacterium]